MAGRNGTAIANYDVIIAGAGIVGLSLAVRLAQTPLRIAVVDRHIASDQIASTPDIRVSAMTRSSIAFFKAHAIWPLIPVARRSPFTHITVFDGRCDGEVQFDCTALGVNALGHVLENQVILAALMQHIKACDRVTLLNAELKQLNVDQAAVRLTCGEQTLCAQLLVGADGAQSWVRKQAGFLIRYQAYGQKALVTQVTTTLPHEGCAMQRFAAPGILAFLPLKHPNISSIVYSHTPQAIDELMDCSATAFAKAISEAFSYRLGAVTDSGQRRAFTLQMQHATHYVQPRLALIGDAAHTLHPLAGQGVNLGIMDARVLADVIVKAYQKGRDWGAYDTLRRYERWRKGHNQTMIHLMAALQTLFASDNELVCNLRACAMRLTQHQGWIKRAMMRFAMGYVDDWEFYQAVTKR